MLNKLNIRKARAKMQFLLGGQGYAIRDKGASSKAARRAARTKVGVLQQALEDAALPEHKLDKLSKTLAVQCFLSEYYRYKLGVLDSDLGFLMFSLFNIALSPCRLVNCVPAEFTRTLPAGCRQGWSCFAGCTSRSAALFRRRPARRAPGNLCKTLFPAVGMRHKHKHLEWPELLRYGADFETKVLLQFATFSQTLLHRLPAVGGHVEPFERERKLPPLR